MLISTVKLIVLSICVVLFINLAGCVSTQKVIEMENFKIENIDSNSVNVIRSYLIRTEEGTLLRGKLAQRFPVRGPIPGHLHVELIAQDGKVIKKVKVGYKRRRIKSRDAHFSFLIPDSLPRGSTIRVIHHDVQSH